MFVALLRKTMSIYVSVALALLPGAAPSQQTDPDFTNAPTG